jgi:hypothetical protein
MRFLLLPSFMMLMASQTAAQITIQSQHLPDAGDTLITRNAMFSSDFDVDDTGVDHEWNIGFDLLEPLMLNANNYCYDVDQTPIIYQFMFNNPFDAAHNSDFAQGVEQAAVGTISFQNAYMYYQNSATRYTVTGMGASINGLPLAAQMNAPDLLFKLPLVYGAMDSSSTVMSFDVPNLGAYILYQKRNYECDGWGTLNIWDQEFEVLRLKSTVVAADSVFTSFLNMGIRLPRPETVTYEWWSTAFKVPVLKITETAGIIVRVEVANIYNPPSHVNELQATSFSIYPNPANNWLSLQGDVTGATDIIICDLQGKVWLQHPLSQGTKNIDISALPNGMYTLTLNAPKGQRSQSFIKTE